MLTADQVQSQASAYLAPIAGAERAGSNPQLDPRYDELRRAMASLDSPTGGDVEWPRAAKLGEELLSKAAKDLLVASYTAYAMLQTRGLAGLAVGLRVLQGLFETYWEDMHPPARRPRGRGNALDWLVGRLEFTIPALKLEPDDRPVLDLVSEQWKQLSTLAREKLDEHCPSMRGVADALQRHALTLPAAPAPTSTADTGPPDLGGPASGPATTPSAGPAAPAPPAADQAAPPQAASPQPLEAPQAEQSPLEALKAAGEPWLAPIPGGEGPTGSDPKFDSEYEEAKTEVAKLDSPTTDPPDWAIVAKRADAVLKSKGKDLLMGCYWAYARFVLGGLTELPLGLVVVAELLERYGEAVYPSRPRGRGNAVGWLVGQLDQGLAGLKLQPSDRATVIALESTAKHLATSARTHLGEHAPGMGPLTERVARLLLAVPEPKPEPPPKAATPPTPAPTPASSSAAAPTPRVAAAPSTPLPAVQADVSNPQEVEQFLIATGTALTRAGTVLRQADLANPSAYRLVRQGLWLHLTQPPPANAGGKTQVPALPEKQRKQYETILSNGKWPALIEETESALTRFRFSLDLNFMTWTALDGLGDSHAAAKTAVVAEVAALLRRMPTLLDLAAGDGSPFANDATKAWLNAHVLAGPGGGATEGASADDPGEAMAEVRKLMKAGKATDAMRKAKAAIEAAGPRQRLLRRIVLAETVLEAGQPVLARGMFAALDREIEERALLEWEPALVGRCLDGLVRSIRAANKAGQKFDGADRAFERLCMVDPAAAARLSG